MASTGWSETAYRRLDEQDTRIIARWCASPNSQRFPACWSAATRGAPRLFGIVANAAQWSLLVVIVLGIGGGIFVARRVLQRIDAMTGTTRRIMAGDLSGRLPVGRSWRRARSSRGKTSTRCWSASRR
jgi:HAMP domain-containing protein